MLNRVLWEVANRMNYYRRIIKARSVFSYMEITEFYRRLEINKISKSQEEGIKKVWGKRLSKADYRWYDIFNTLHPEHSEELWKFIPPSYFLSYIDPWLVNIEKIKGISDKNLYERLMPDVVQVETVMRYNYGIFQDKEFRHLDDGRVRELLMSSGPLAVKPSQNTSCGHNILFWDPEKDDIDALFKHMGTGSNWIIQKKFRQHPLMASLNNSSANSVRVLMLYKDGESQAFGSICRFGHSGSTVDNKCSGGFYVGIQDDGSLQNTAYSIHDEIISIKPFKIPGYHRCIEIARQNAPVFSGMSRLTVFDFLIGEDGEPALLEVNLGCTDVEMIQVGNGPVLGKYIEWFLSFVPQTRRPKRYVYSDII